MKQAQERAAKAQAAQKKAAEEQKQAQERAEAQARAQAQAHAAAQAQAQAQAGFGAQAAQYGFSSPMDQQANEMPQWATESYGYMQPQVQIARARDGNAQRATVRG